MLNDFMEGVIDTKDELAWKMLEMLQELMV
jgi:hypothetical protein